MRQKKSELIQNIYLESSRTERVTLRPQSETIYYITWLWPDIIKKSLFLSSFPPTPTLSQHSLSQHSHYQKKEGYWKVERERWGNASVESKSDRFPRGEYNQSSSSLLQFEGQVFLSKINKWKKTNYNISHIILYIRIGSSLNQKSHHSLMTIIRGIHESSPTILNS